MAVFKFVISDGKKSYQVEKEQKDCPVLGKKIGEKLPGDFLGLSSYELQITGGSDKDGFPMKSSVEGILRKRFIATQGIGFRTDIEGLRKRKMLRGNAISADVVQINCKIAKRGEISLEELFGKKENVEEAEKKAEQKVKEEKKEKAEK